MMYRRIMLGALLPVLLLSCSRDGDFAPGKGSQSPVQPERRSSALPSRHTLLMISGGHNSLSSYLSNDQIDIEEGYLPQGKGVDENALLILSRIPVNFHSTTSVPVLYRLYRDSEGGVVRDTLYRWGEGDRLFGDGVIRKAMEIMRNRVPSSSYGMVLSSHASGWLPPGYFSKPDRFENSGKSPALRSIGEDLDGSVSLEMDLQDFAASIPYLLSYVILDCCLSGGVEVAWALRGKAEMVAFSQTETMADGFDYQKLMRSLLGSATPNPQEVCEDFYSYYMAKSSVNQSATISLVDTDKMDALASVCRTLFEKYRSAIKTLDGDRVQGYFRYERHYFYDLEDILVKAGISEGEHAQLTQALQSCIIYKAATPAFMKGTQYGFDIVSFCGLSMYLPSMGTRFLDNYYQENIGWNQQTQLVL